MHAVFENTIYLKRLDLPDKESGTTAALCCIGHASLQPGPINVRTSLQKIPTFAVGEHWYCRQQSLTIGKNKFDLAQAELWLPPFQQCSKPVYSNVELLAQYFASRPLTDNSATNNDRDSRPSIDAMVEQRLSVATKNLQHWLECSSNKIKFPAELLGCGTGLTPAGDDVLVGVLVAMHTWRHPKRDELIAHVTNGISNTNDISGAHLLAACAGSGIEPLHHLVGAISQAYLKRDVVAAAETLRNYGYSSGYYALKGVLLAARSFTQDYRNPI